MKRLLYIFAISVLLLPLIGRNHANAAALPTDGAPITLSDTCQEALVPQAFHTLEEYEQYISRFTDRSEFYTYEIIAELGDLRFHSFTHLRGASGESGTPDGKCMDYAYDLITASNQILTFRVYPVKPNAPSEAPISSDFSNPRDLRINEGVTGWRSIKDILYYYDNGVLKTIQLPIGNNTIQLTMPDGFSDYPLSADINLPKSDIISNFLGEGDALIGRYTFNEYLSAAPRRAPGFDDWKAQHEIVQKRYEQFCSQNSSLQNLRIVPFNKRLLHYVIEPEQHDGLNANINFEDFLSIEVSVTTTKELHQQVGAPHMTCVNAVSSITNEVYLTADGYCIVYSMVASDPDRPIMHAVIQKLDWQETQEYEAFRLEMLEQHTKKEPPQILQQYILGGIAAICFVAVAIILIKRRK